MQSYAAVDFEKALVDLILFILATIIALSAQSPTHRSCKFQHLFQAF